jgi:branched-chain amino acid transport system ATP-binding protein
MSGAAGLTIENLGIRFGGLVALEGVSIDVAPRTIHAVIGPNGAGKTTLLNLVTGLYRPTTGRVVLDGETLTGLPPHRIVARGVARTFQNTELFVELSARDNVLVGLHPHLRYGIAAAALRLPGFLRAERAAAERTEELLALVGLADQADRLAGDLALGQQRRLELARALAVGPRLLMLDEPAAGLRAAEADGLIAVLRRLCDEVGLTLVLIDHVMRVVMGVSDRITVLNHGRRLAEGTPEEVRRDPAVVAAYLGGAPHGA